VDAPGRPKQHVFGTWEWADCWYRHLGAGAKLTIAAASRPDGETVAILPTYLARERPVRLTRFVGAGLSDELGPVCAPADLASAGGAAPAY
jgi:CelD/BcsL family acetyltransferase involved in cellulose biosynthesis